MNIETARGVMYENCLFDSVSDADREIVLRDATLRSFDKAANILEQGEPCEGMYLLVSGHVNVSIVNEAGHQANLIRAGRGDIIGDLEAMACKPCLASCRSEPGMSALFWGRNKLDSFLAIPQLARNLIAISYHRISFINQVRSISQSAPVEAQIVDCLLRMSATDPVITLSQAYIAEAVGCSRQTVNRVLGKLRDKGVLSLRKAKIEIHKREDLEKFLQSSSCPS